MQDNRVYYKPSETPFIYDFKDFKLYFSSLCDMERFKRIYNDREEANNLKLQSMYKIVCDFEVMLILYYYKLAEHRFFYVEYKGKLLEKEYCAKLELSI